MQELQGMNIQLRIITEDNIDQLSSMAFSDNIIRLTGEKDITATKVARNAQSKNKVIAPIMQTTPKPNPYDTDSPQYVPESPPYAPESPQAAYDPNSPQFGLYNDYGQMQGGPMYEGEPKTGKMHLDMNVSKKEPLAWGWMFDSSDYESGDIYRSLIIEDDGKSSSKWWVDDHDYQVPAEHPHGWDNGDLVKSDGSIIEDNTVIGALLADQHPGNWKRVIAKLNPGKYPEAAAQQDSTPYKPVSSPYQPTSPPYAPDSTPYQPVSPNYDPEKPPGNSLPNVSPQYVVQSPPYAPESPVEKVGGGCYCKYLHAQY